MAELREVLKHMIATLGPRRGKLLDFGCGIGQFAEMAQSAGFDVAGIEIDAHGAMAAKVRTGATVWEKDLDVDPLPIENYDAVTMLDLIEHVQDPVALLRRAHDRLSNGGKIIVFMPNHDSLIAKVARALESATGGRAHRPVDHIFDCVHVTFFTVDSLALALQCAGFAVEATHFVDRDGAGKPAGSPR
ncbi:bifunctional 2-polyprenyl-6-hydroxyphenol methylase/3-demethylubiquinol 3-O-methyltransferase UbiG [Bradyrhizobium sp. CCBAU 51753]|uniref:class I SAM-dependent methyltransferase n=1 Tax=Bradyrhizobium sp. CCBAU 51753 TaxID=1325100 RepID=UPI00188CA428|nr:class I SAM-dependent methyltransferase [Bradyrhizobium sp. CCBAU 51753]